MDKDERKPMSYRPSKKNRDKIVKALLDKQTKEQRPSLNNTIEVVLMEALKIK